MTTIIYSFKNKKPVFFELQRFYKVKNAKKLDKLIDKLLDLEIDAVGSPMPEDLSFPCVLELQSGFSLNLKPVNIKNIKQNIKNLKRLIK